VIALEFSLLERWVLPYVRYLLRSPSLATTGCWVLSLAIAAPLIMGMFMSYRKLPAIHRFPALLGVSLLVPVELFILSVIYFPSKYVSLALVLLLIALFLLFQRNFAAIYTWLEQNFKLLFGETAFSSSMSEDELSNWHGGIAEVICQNPTLFVGNLTVAEFATKFKVTVAVLTRAGNQKVLPDAASCLVLGDQLTVVGPSSAINHCQEILAEMPRGGDYLSAQELFIYSVKVGVDDPALHQTLANIALKQLYPGVIMGILHAGKREWYPQMDRVVEIGDELLIARPREKR